MRPVALVPVVLLLGGVAIVVYAVLDGAASVALLVVVPLVYGGSGAFLIGAVLLFLGILTLPLAFAPVEPAPVPRERPVPGGDPSSAGTPAAVSGLVLIGPVPIFFGGWRTVSLRTRILVAALAAALLVALVLWVALR
jgi:uncharacterized membrane protein